jgi:hypothetical protein
MVKAMVADLCMDLLDELLTLEISRMCFAGKQELYRTISAAKNPRKTIHIVHKEICPLVRRKAPCEADRECVRLQTLLDPQCLIGRKRCTVPKQHVRS